MPGKDETAQIGAFTFKYNDTTKEGRVFRNADLVLAADDRGRLRLVGQKAGKQKENFKAHASGLEVANLEHDGTAGSGSALALNYIHTPDGNVLGLSNIGGSANSTLPVLTGGSGLNIAGEQTDDDGWEVFGNMLAANGRPFIAGYDPAFFFRCKLNIADVSGTDDLQVGFRKAETPNAAFDDYLDAVTLGINAAENPAKIKIATIEDNGATSETDTTDTVADGVSVEFKILVDADGAVTYEIDGSAPSATAAVTLDTGTPLIPFVRCLQDSGLTGDIFIEEWEAGYQL